MVHPVSQSHLILSPLKNSNLVEVADLDNRDVEGNFAKIKQFLIVMPKSNVVLFLNCRDNTSGKIRALIRIIEKFQIDTFRANLLTGSTE